MDAAVAKKKGEARPQGTFDVRAPLDWIARVDEEARRLGLSRSAYIRSVVTREMDRAAAERRAQGQE